jgi:hypothetical protein
MAMIQVPFGNATVSRNAPLMRPQAYKTYGVSMPLSTHWRKATCEEAGCTSYLEGFVTTLDLSTPTGAKLADIIRHDKTRKHSMQQVSATMAKFVFPPGTECFRSFQHKVPVGRPSRFIVRGGNFLGNPDGHKRVFKNGEEWTDDFSGHLDRLNNQRNRG